MKLVSKKDLLFVYDRELHKKLKEDGIKFLVTATSNEHKKFWLYSRLEAEHTLLQHLNNQ